jgi:hypothetical protein
MRVLAAHGVQSDAVRLDRNMHSGEPGYSDRLTFPGGEIRLTDSELSISRGDYAWSGQRDSFSSDDEYCTAFEIALNRAF